MRKLNTACRARRPVPPHDLTVVRGGEAANGESATPTTGPNRIGNDTGAGIINS